MLPQANMWKAERMKEAEIAQNAIMVLEPFAWRGLWVFNDDRVGLYREPFVFGIDDMIDVLTEDYNQPWKGFLLYFSLTPPPTGDFYHLKAIRLEDGGMWYREVRTRMCGWLCPATLLYFQDFPAELYCWAKEIDHEGRKM